MPVIILHPLTAFQQAKRLQSFFIKVNQLLIQLLQCNARGFLASLVVENHAMTMERLQLLDSQVSDSLLGIHLEGPFLNPKQKAVMKEEFLRLPGLLMQTINILRDNCL